MSRTTILACFGCRRPVGHTGKSDAAVHVSYDDIQRAEGASRTWNNATKTHPCATCGKPAIAIDGVPGRFHLDGSDNRSCDFKAPMYANLSIESMFNLPEPAAWAVHCDDCNPHAGCDGTYCNGCYWFDAQRCRTWEQAASWTGHLLDKGWLTSTNWGRFLQSLGPADA